MAIVKNTTETCNFIVAEYNHQTKGQLTKVREAAKLNKEDTERLIRACIGVMCESHNYTLAEFDKIPREFLPSTKGGYIQSVNDVDVNPYLSSEATHMTCPPEMNSYGYIYTFPPGHDVWVEERLLSMRNADEQYKALVAERRMMEDQIYKVLQQVPTLNKALKVWPELIHLVPNHLKARLEKKVERNPASSTSQGEIKGVDFGKLNASLVKIKMSNV